jgi:ATP-dependent protease ClpP protease subunit
VNRPDYKENVDRALYIFGKIERDLVYRLTPQINRLRLSGSEPITVYIDSPGGFVHYAEVIQRLLKLPDTAGKTREVITVVANYAASAAADLLALGDYAIAYAGSQIVYHGSRENALPEITLEAATTLASSLRKTNEFFAARLASRTFRRFVLRLTQLKSEFNAFRNDDCQVIGRKFPPLIQALPVSEANQRLLNESLERQNKIHQLTISVETHLPKSIESIEFSASKVESEIFKAILNYKIEAHKKDDWLLSGAGLSEIVADFELLNDFHFGSQARALTTLTKIYGELLLSDPERETYSSQETEKDKKDWVAAKSEPRLRNLWYFTVSLCRILQSADFELGPEDAYWLGLVDEVPGSGLPNLREMLEQKNAQQQKSNLLP